MRPLFVAEVSANHLGDLDRALEIIEVFAKAGANAIKFQTYTANSMTLDIQKFSVESDHVLWGGRKLFDLYQEAHTPWDWHPKLFEKCLELNVIPFSSPFDIEAVELLESLDCALYKVASLESTHFPLIERIAQTKRPVIISTGATSWSELEEIVEFTKQVGITDLTLLVCTSSYPANPVDSHIARLKTISDSFNVKVGLSDHTLGIGVSVAAVALGATVIEKHVTLSRKDGGADSAFSLEPSEFEMLVREGNAAYDSIGSPEWKILDSESNSRLLRRSLYISSQVVAGELVTSENIKAIRPGGGLEPKYYKDILGMRFTKDCEIGTPLSFDIIDKS